MTNIVFGVDFGVRDVRGGSPLFHDDEEHDALSYPILLSFLFASAELFV